MAASSMREISGSRVLLRMLSTLRAPLSTSVQRAATCVINDSSYYISMRCVARSRRAILPILSRTICLRFSSRTG